MINFFIPKYVLYIKICIYVIRIYIYYYYYAAQYFYSIALFVGLIRKIESSGTYVDI